MIGFKDFSRRFDSGAKTIKKTMSMPAKTNQEQKAHEHSSKMSKGCKHIKKTMSIPTKTQNYKKTYEHSNENEKGVQTHQKTHGQVESWRHAPHLKDPSAALAALSPLVLRRVACLPRHDNFQNPLPHPMLAPHASLSA